MEQDDNNGSYCEECGVYNNSSRTECRKCKSPMGENQNELLCPVCHDPAGKHINHDGGGGCVTNKGSEICGCVISSNSLYELQEQLEKLRSYENPQNYAHMRQLANAAADVLACWMDEDRTNELDKYMGALKRALENYKG